LPWDSQCARRGTLKKIDKNRKKTKKCVKKGQK